MFSLGHDDTQRGSLFLSILFIVLRPSKCHCDSHENQRILTRWMDSIDSKGHYVRQQDCTWVIDVKHAQTVQLSLDYLNLPHPSSRCLDYLQIKDHSNFSRQFCGSHSELAVNVLYLKQPVVLHFVIRSSVATNGFSVSYIALPERVKRQATTCGSNYNTNHTFTIPDYPKSPASDWNCEIHVFRENHFIVVSIDTSSVVNRNQLIPTCGQSPIKIKLDNEIQELCEVKEKLFTSPSLSLTFNNAENPENWVGHIEIYLLPECNHIIPKSTAPTVIKTPFHPDTPPLPYRCKWQVESSSPYVVVKMVKDTSDVSLPECIESPLMISLKSGNFPLCQDTPMVVHTGGLNITYSTVPVTSDTWKGEFEIHFTENYSPSCGSSVSESTRTLKNWTGELESPGFSDGSYPNNINCTWLIDVQTASNILLTFEFFSLRDSIGYTNKDDVCEDYLKVTGTQPLQQLFYKCGTANITMSVISDTGQMTLQFFSDISYTGKGFKASYKGLCRAVAESPGDILTPNFPNSLPNDIIKCTWKLYRKQHYTLIKLAGADSEKGKLPECGASTVEIQLENEPEHIFELCKTQSVLVQEGELLLHFNYLPGILNQAHSSPWVGKIGIAYVQNKHEVNCSWLCSQSHCEFKPTGNKNFHCLCSDRHLNLPCEEHGDLCLAEECNASLCRRRIQQNTVFLTPNYPSPPIDNINCMWKLDRPNYFVLIKFVNESLKNIPECGDSPVKVSYVNAASQRELCKSNPVFMYHGFVTLYYTYEVTGNRHKWIGKLAIDFVETPSDLDCMNLCMQSECKLTFNATTTPLTSKCLCQGKYMGLSCKDHGDICLAEECVFGHCWRDVDSKTILETPNYPRQPVDYMRCEWRLYQAGHMIFLKYIDEEGSRVSSSATSPFQLLLDNSTEIEIKKNTVLIYAGRATLFYTFQSNWIGQVAVDFVQSPMDTNCGWLCDQTHCQVKINTSTSNYICLCQERHQNLSCEAHGFICQAEPCIFMPENVNVTFCQDEKNTLNIQALTWTKTRTSLTDVENCPFAEASALLITRKCVEDENNPSVGKWTRPNMTDCMTKALDTLDEISKSLERSSNDSTITDVMEKLETYISVINQSVFETALDSNLVTKIGDILSKASDLETNLSLPINETKTLMNQFVKAVDFITDRMAINVIKKAKNKEQIGSFQSLILESTSKFFKKLVRKQTDIQVAETTKPPNFEISTKNVDVRLRLWSNKRLLMDYHQWTAIDLSPLVAKESEDYGKPLWIFISRMSNLKAVLELSKATQDEEDEEEDEEEEKELSWTELSQTNTTSEQNEKRKPNATKEMKKYESTLVSRIVSVELFNRSSFGVNIPMTVVFALEQEPILNARFMCVFLNTENSTAFGTWNPTGCELASQNMTHAVCHCYHFTNFAVLMDIYETQRSYGAKHQVTLSYISYIGSFLSILSCVALIVLYYILRLKSDRVAIHKQFAVSIIIVQILFLIMANTSESGKLHYNACMGVAVLLHYSVTVMFFWMLIEGVHLYVTLVYVFCTKTFFWKYFLVSWGIPILMVGVALGVFKEKYRSENLCWIHTTVLRLFLVPTLSVVVVINVLILTRVIAIIIRSKSCLNLLDKSEQQLFWTGLKASAVLLPLLGLTWMFAFFTVSAEISEFLSHLFTYLFTVFNSFQGLLLFLFHCVLSSEVKAAFQNYMRKNFNRFDSEMSRSKYLKETTTSEFPPSTMSPLENTTTPERPRETKDSVDSQQNVIGNLPHHESWGTLSYVKESNIGVDDLTSAHPKQNVLLSSLPLELGKSPGKHNEYNEDSENDTSL